MRKIGILFLTFALLLGGCRAEETKDVTLYFVTADKKEIVSERRAVHAENEDLLRAAVESLLKGPEGAGLTRIIPVETTLLSVQMSGTVAEVNFSASFDTGTIDQRLLSRYTVIYTACALPQVQKARLLVEGEPLTSLRNGEVLGALGAADVSLGKAETEAAEVVTLYFADEKGETLVAEERQITLTAGQKMEMAIMEELIRGPRVEGHTPVLVPQTEVLSVETQDGVTFVNLGASFLTLNAGDAKRERMAVDAIVNTLCRLPDVQEVRFLVEGETVETFGSLTFNEKFKKPTE